MAFSSSRGWPALILSAMFALMLASSLGDSGTMDELAHIPAGYSYVKFRDYRLNPEHPPLAKALAALPLLFLDLNYPSSDRSWTEDVNGQWVQGAKFLYESGNDPDTIMFLARLPMMLLTLAFGALFYHWSRNRFGSRVALLALTLFAFSPTVLAHGRYVTTDVAASFGFFIGLITFIRFLERPTKKNVLLAGLTLGAALLLKFSTFLLIPIYGVLFLLWVIVHRFKENNISTVLLDALSLFFKSIAIGVIALILVWIVYGVFTANYPAERQISDSRFLLSSYGNRTLAGLQEKLMELPLTRPLAHYVLGLLMVVQRASGGNLNYFLGEVTNAGSRLYFPLLYLVKEPLPLHILTLMALTFSLRAVMRIPRWGIADVSVWVRRNFVIFAAGFFILFYWLYTIRSPLNIGVRHVLPTFPFIYLLVSRKIAHWLEGASSPSPRNVREVFTVLYQRLLAPLPRYIFVGILVLWLVLETVAAAPHFLPYYNQLAGGTSEGYRIAVDSNYDWGQDLKRLAAFVEAHDIQNIYLDYFGAGSPRTEFGDRFVEWNSRKGEPPRGSYFAVSATFMQNALGRARPDVARIPGQSYEWLGTLEPIGRAGYSIFVFKVP